MLTIVIVSYNSAAALQKCQHEFLSSGRFPVVIVDNASRDGSADLLAARYPQATLIRLPRNEGYGRAANRGLEAVQTPYAFLLNPDLEITADTAAQMLRFAQEHDGEACLFAPAVSPKSYLRQGALRREWVSGAAMLFRMADFRELGFFDEAIFLYSEDSDLCRRIVDSGRHILLDSDLLIRHLQKQSSAPNPAIDALRNWHRGWSQMYVPHKHGDSSGWLAPRWTWFRYWLKGKLSGSVKTRTQHAQRAEGMMAFLHGEQAFLPDGRARGTDRL
ncbi:MAG TPA: glycosyltransferase family 2 protein [Thiobacillaceae bacterium]